jgi:23S rRNA (pseudouridine1915-N3)-methyltransferase
MAESRGENDDPRCTTARLKLLIVAVGQRMPGWVDAGFADYARRMPREMRLTLTAIRPEPRESSTAVERLREAEARRIRSAIPAGALKVVLDESGRTCSTKALVERCRAWQMEGRDVAFIVGGPDGLADGIRREANWLWSLSPLTLPHGLVRVVLAEQLYRASSILKNHPYHRE